MKSTTDQINTKNNLPKSDWIWENHFNVLYTECGENKYIAINADGELSIGTLHVPRTNEVSITFEKACKIIKLKNFQ